MHAWLCITADWGTSNSVRSALLGELGWGAFAANSAEGGLEPSWGLAGSGVLFEH